MRRLSCEDAGDIAEARSYAAGRDLRDPYMAYTAHRLSARSRGIAWGFTFVSWWSIWRPYYHLRGRGTNGLCMARLGDEGAYDPGNVYLTTNLGNLSDYHRRCSRAIEARKRVKERHETEFARIGSRSVGTREEKMSHLTYKAFNTSKSTCNQDDDGLE